MSFDRPKPRLRPLVVFAAMVVALALQTTVMNSFAIGGVKPDLVLVLALCAGLLVGPGGGAVYGALGGLLEGYSQGYHLGTLGFSRAIAAFVAGTVEAHLLRDNVIVPTITVFFGSLVAHVVYFVMAPEFPLARPVRIAVTESLLNMILTPFLYLALAKWGRTYTK